MQLVLWAVGLSTLFLQDFLNVAGATAAAATAARKQGLHLRQAHLLETLSEYEVVTPTRVNEFGEPFPAKVHFQRKKRSLHLDIEPWGPDATSSSINSTTQAHYKLTAFGQHFVFNLTAHSGFIAPLFTVSFLGEPKINQTNFYTEEESDIKHCFYKGHVNTEPQHTAVISLCSGMLGTFRSHDGEYFVEPLFPPDQQEYEEEHKKPHVVYRHTMPPAFLPRDKQTCDTSGHSKNHRKFKSRSKTKQWPLTSILSDVEALKRSLASERFLEFSKNKTGNEWGTNSHRRTKRFLSYPRFVEVMVVADSRMLAYHGANLQHYILTLMSIVASIYKDPSIGNLINIVIVKLAIIQNEQDGPSISYNAQTTLKNFCQWQKTQNHPNEEHPDKHDTAVLVTRQDICRAHDKCDTLGLAELGTVCDPYRSCSISEDSGLSTAFTIAHELGHVFNMPHDDNNKCKEDGGKSQQHVMAPTLSYNTNPWMWSKCSRKYITEFLDTGYGECLLDEPTSRTYTLPQQLPGYIYDVNKQCELIFGPGAKVCPYMKQCRRLWCINADGAHKGCRTQHTPWADGTECGLGKSCLLVVVFSRPDYPRERKVNGEVRQLLTVSKSRLFCEQTSLIYSKHCKYGHCVPREREIPVTDGAWGTWSPFGACSRTCGGGIKNAVRECNRPEPKNGGRYCVGRRMKFKSCNTEPCPKQKKDFRDEQCAVFDGKHFNINGLPPNVRWVPKYSGILMKDRCKLFCRVAGNTAYYQLRDRVIDGTPCGPDTNDICVQGLCRQAGCDHVLNSKARRDKCGVCGGDNSSCKTVAGTFNTVHYGYNTVIRIPAGATNIDVRQHSYSGKPEDDNYLALSSNEGFILNGDYVVSMFKKEIKVGNAVIEYSGSDTPIERINSTYRIDQEIVLQVLSVGNLYNPDVRYTFNIPIEDKPQQFFWNTYGPWQPCSKLCQGERKRKPICTRESDQLMVSDQRCDQIPQPVPITESCNTNCELRWHIARKSECTAQCGSGFQILEISCTKYSKTEGKIEKYDDQYCSGIPKPNSREKCSSDCNTGGWRYSTWTECSKSCGGGTRRRRAVCMNTFNDILEDSKCSQQEKVTMQRCNELACPQWKTGDWSECLVTCGKGHKHRQIWCQFGGERLNDRICNLETKPDAVQSCQRQECAAWQVGPWGQCTATCGQGYQMRAVKCVVGAYVSVVDDNECNAATKPTDTQDCEIAPCRHHPSSSETKQNSHRTQWRFGSWTPCSTTCGKGTRMRYVSCRDDQGSVADEAACFHLPKPSATEVCIVTPCGQWKTAEWSSCSVTCGQGKVTRQVVCIDYSDQIVDRRECDADDIPATEQDCSMPSCQQINSEYNRPIYPVPYPDYRQKGGNPNRNQGRVHAHDGNQWRTGPWGACSSTCAGGFQRRVVVCQDENGYTASNCEVRTKPDEQRSCESGPCPQWAYGSWGECSKPCGGGTRTRLVVCQHPNGERFTDMSCEILDKPPDREQCSVQDCPQDVAWSTGPWSSCSVSCGRGQKYREVYCLSKDGKHLDNSLCKQLAKPNVQRKCRGGRCPKWKAGDWGQCSVSCGRGVWQRSVFCHLGSHKTTREIECNQSNRPASEQECQMTECSIYNWEAESWEDCSKTCGEGSRYRKVICRDQNRQEVDSRHCEPGKRPPDVETCNLPPCEYIWITGEWSECSVTCGKGYKQRLVSCSEIYTGKDHYEYGYTNVVNCPGTQPPNVQSCYLGECPVLASWRVGNWGSCSVSCGIGVMHRSVQCLTNNDQASTLCPDALKPVERRACHNIHDCELPTNCKEVKRLKVISEDGEYYLKVKGRLLKIYCAGMESDRPKEYVTLVNGDAENFSEVYSYRLHNPTECPYNGSRKEDCQCRKDYTAAGFSSFNKVRLDLNTMQIITTDLQFAETLDGRPVPYATAGDCYSAAKCPQGRFSINLSGTGLLVTQTSEWLSQGNYAVSEIIKSPDGTKVRGKCGGYCGKCTPSSGTGLDVQVL
ncbi:A disintegrin and metalloproteinase with thrombospondin motifs 9 isoform X2 [Varanus komodoensis]|uniref:A disintegrin and metalloproteinase with thrombospondin motifs 9 isoform X2 n=1 Tax=Varanus komodoensis TaxID=61221 RepID=UPI001CF7A0F1|nr:A disintegrin and metalloproteinase with thrombospondin motifs 9 isoform X2 [Varanus komodoensis]